jgi:hypothetical protein
VTAQVVRVPLVVHLEVKRVLQVIAWLLSSQARHHGRSVGDLRDHKIIRFGQCVSDFADLRRQSACGARRAGLSGSHQVLEVPAADGAFQRADDRARIVIRTGDVQRLAVLAEGDGARTDPRAEMPLGGCEVGVRV